MQLLNKKGFFIFELTITIALILFFTTTVISTHRWFLSFSGTCEIQTLYSFLSYMRQKAMIQQKDLTVTIDRKTRIFKEDDEKDSFYALNDQIAFKINPNTKNAGSNPITFVADKIIFYASGIISSGTIYLYNEANNKQYALSNAISTISYIRLYTYENDTWKTI